MALRAFVIAASAATAVQSLLLAGLVLERRRRRRAEAESRRHLAVMAHLDRRASMGELATSLAHELNQPLNAILQNAGVAQMLLSANPIPPGLGEIADIISDIRKDDVRASEIIRRMRGLLQKHDLESMPVPLSEVVHDTVALVWADAKARKVQIELDLMDDGCVAGDRVHLQQVLLNLLMNAMHAVSAVPSDRRIVRVRTERREREVRLSVSDTGPGIPVDRLADVFEPFYTTKTEDTRMGMGLAIARSIVTAHGGRIGAESNAGAGASVWFSVPAATGCRR